jgi:hypothetical protein
MKSSCYFLFTHLGMSTLQNLGQFSWRCCSFKLAALYRGGTDLKKTLVTCRSAWRGPHRKHGFFYCCEGIFTAPLPSNTIPIVECTCVAGMRLQAPLIDSELTQASDMYSEDDRFKSRPRHQIFWDSQRSSPVPPDIKTSSQNSTMTTFFHVTLIHDFLSSV